MAAKHDHRKSLGHGKPARPCQGFGTHGIGQLYEEGCRRPAFKDGIEDLVGRPVDGLDMKGKRGCITERRTETTPAVGDRFRRAIGADISELRVPQRSGVLDELPCSRGIVAAHIRNRPTSIFPSADRDERIVFRDQPGEFLTVEFATENQTAIGDPEPVAFRKNLAVIADAGAGQQQKIIGLLLRLFLDTQQERREEVGLRARESRLVGENAEDAVQPLGHSPRDRVGDITCLANDRLYPFAGFSRDARNRGRCAIQNKRYRCLTDAGKLGDVVLREAFMIGHAMPSPTSDRC
ncbi:hypothetical protein D3C86_1325090 [compost metagenome]